jgi:methionyl-tRNA formyltransferase
MTSHGGKPLKLSKVQALPTAAAGGRPGRVLEWDDGAAVVTGDGLLLLEEVQLAGKRALPIGDFLRGRRGFMGSVLGSSVDVRLQRAPDE